MFYLLFCSSPTSSLTVVDGSPLKNNLAVVQRSLPALIHPSSRAKCLKVHLFRCRTCSKLFTNPLKMELHEHAHTVVEQYHRDVNTSPDSQFRHLSSSQKPYQCAVCGLAFSRQCTMSAHLGVHRIQRPYQCLFCGKTFSQECSLKIHSRVHPTEKQFQCHICGRLFAYLGNLTKHRRGHCLHEFLCESCGLPFSLESSLDRHQSMNRVCPMEFCLKVFLCCDRLKEHFQQEHALFPSFQPSFDLPKLPTSENSLASHSSV